MQTLAEQLRLARIEADLRKWERFRFFTPYPTQMKFITATAQYRSVMMSAPNGGGKTELAAFMMACDLTGEYPEWWDGHRYGHPIDAWACGRAGGQMIDTMQLKIFGRLGENYGSGMIPKRCFVGEPTMSRHATGFIDSQSVRHVSGGLSRISQRAYSQNVVDWQGPRLHLIHYDEEPPVEHFGEGEARLTGADGRSRMTFTPMAGPTEVVRLYTDDDTGYRSFMTMGMDEAKHISEEEKKAAWAKYRPHERDARYHGKIMLGEGAIFTTPEDDLLVDLPLAHVPNHWLKGWGLDFGGSGPVAHPFGAVLMAHDQDEDEYYVLATVRMREALPLQHADAIRRIAPDVRAFWPHDGHIVGDTGEEKAALYKKHGVKMYHEHATDTQGSKSTWAGIHVMDDVMQARRWKVRRELLDWRQEYRMYHMKNGKIVKVRDDLMSATRTAMMMRRFWRPGPIGGALFPTGVRRRPTEARPLDPWTGVPVPA